MIQKNSRSAKCSLVRDKKRPFSDFKDSFFRMNYYLTLKLVQMKGSLLRNIRTMF